MKPIEQIRKENLEKQARINGGMSYLADILNVNQGQLSGITPLSNSQYREIGLITSINHLLRKAISAFRAF